MLPPVLSIWLIIYSYIFITLICVETQECVWHKSAVLMLSTVGCTLKLFLCSKQKKVFVYLGCYTLHYIAMCGLGGVLVPVVGTAMQHILYILYIYICVGARCRWDGLTHTGVCV